jgi:Caspase domain
LANPYFHRGLAFEYKGEFGRALADFEAALSLKPGYREASNGRERVRAALAANAPAPKPPVQPKPPPPVVAASCGSSKRVALVIGNSAYAGRAQLTNPVNDADDVSALLRSKLCFKVIEAKDTSFATFSQKITEFAEAADSADVALFYYAGHGIAVSGNQPPAASRRQAR